jgi:hypothetical protein
MSPACGRSLGLYSGAGAGPQDTGDRLKPPGRTPTCSQGPVVEGGGDPAQRGAFGAQPLDFRERFLFQWIGFQMFARKAVTFVNVSSAPLTW